MLVVRRRDLEVLRWVGEQYAARADQLEPLLGCGDRTVQRVLARLRTAELVQTRRLLVGDPAWVLPTARGLRASGCGLDRGGHGSELLAHVAAVNDVRIHVEARTPGGEWVCERAHSHGTASSESTSPTASCTSRAAA